MQCTPPCCVRMNSHFFLLPLASSQLLSITPITCTDLLPPFLLPICFSSFPSFHLLTPDSVWVDIYLHLSPYPHTQMHHSQHGRYHQQALKQQRQLISHTKPAHKYTQIYTVLSIYMYCLHVHGSKESKDIGFGNILQ